MGKSLNTKFLLTLLLCGCGIFSSSAGAFEEHPVSLSGGTEIPVTRFAAPGDRVLWLPTEYGLRFEAAKRHAEILAEMGFEVWITDLHAAYFVPPGRSSLTDMPLKEIAELIKRAQDDGRRLFIFSGSRGGALALRAVRRYQLDYPRHRALGGLLLMHPNLSAGSPEPGREMDYLPVAELSNVPVFIAQPRNSAKYWYLKELVKKLQSGGSSVFTYLVEKASDGYYVRSNISAEEQQAAAQLPSVLKRGMFLLNAYNKTPRRPPAGDDAAPWTVNVAPPALHLYRGESQAPPLRLLDMNKEQHDLASYRGQVVLLNFWATWCPPCVKEIPSLGRLQTRFAGEDFKVLAVSVAEPRTKIQAFLDKIPADFTVLADPEGSSVADWKIRAFPTNFLLDRQGRIRYAYFGALEWDKAEVVAVVESLL